MGSGQDGLGGHHVVLHVELDLEVGQELALIPFLDMEEIGVLEVQQKLLNVFQLSVP